MSDDRGCLVALTGSSQQMEALAQFHTQQPEVRTLWRQDGLGQFGWGGSYNSRWLHGSTIRYRSSKACRPFPFVPKI
jgi:hypothetical protein